MQNLKIQVNSADESKEIQNILESQGFKKWEGWSELGSIGGFIWTDSDMTYCDNRIGYFDGSPRKEITLPELRAMVNPMKEYLIPDNGGYRVAVQDAGLPISGDWIEIPEGAVKFLFSKENNNNYHFANENNQLMSLTDINYGRHDWYGNAENYMTQCKVDVLWQRDQDEPFLTPECTLNDQYAEIEQVGQQTIEQTLAERQSTYGNFEDVAFVTENIMAILAKVRVNELNDLPNTHRMALYMIASKMARIVNGDFNHLDSWHDIGGYAKLIEKLIKGE